VANSASPIHCLIVRSRTSFDPRARELLAGAHTLGFTNIYALECNHLYFVQGHMSNSDLQILGEALLADPVAQTYEWKNNFLQAKEELDQSQIIEMALRPGVTDPVADQIVRYAQVLAIDSIERAATGQQFIIHSAHRLSEQGFHTLARRLLTNPVIQRYAIGEITPMFPHKAEASTGVEIIPIRELDSDGLLALSRQRRTALDLYEMQAIQTYYRSIGRDPTDVELETLAQTWSEHCSHKTFNAQISIIDSQSTPRHPIDGLLRTYISAATEIIAAPWVRSAFVDNAGIIDFDDEFEISFKVETHNHPSAIEPFGGANTGTGGVVRDILGVSAKPIAATDVLCFGPQDLELERLPEGALHPCRIRAGVVAGIQDYGNKLGIPTVNGAILYDPSYTANPLVFCGCVGIAPKDRHLRRPQPGDRIIVIGGRTGRDGLRGATFSSMAMDAQTGEVAGSAVQIGDPITEKGLIEVVIRARDLGLYHAITDCGGGGLSSAVGEMASKIGADVDLAHVRLKYPGLDPWEIWLSEAQERMVLAVPRRRKASLQELCDTFDVELTDIGEYTGSGHLVVRYDGGVVLDLANDFLYERMPQRLLTAELSQAESSAQPYRPPIVEDLAAVLLKLLSHPNIASKAEVIRIYDHEVQGGTVVKPLTGAMNDGPSDACVIKPLGTKGMRGIVLSNGINPEFGKSDPYRMALSVVDEAIRNAVAVGADPDRIALLDNFCWGDPLRPQSLGELVQAARGCYDAAVSHRAPFISGKDSLNNEYLGTDGLRHAIPATLLISAIGIIEDVTQAVTMDLKEQGNIIYLLGDTWLELKGSHFNLVYTSLSAKEYSPTDHGDEVPSMPLKAPALYRALHRAMRAGLVCACHDLSEGGLAVAAAEMCIAGRLGLSLTINTDDPVTTLFSESNGRFLAEVIPENCMAFEMQFAADTLGRTEMPIQRLGQVTSAANLTIDGLFTLPIDQLISAWKGSP